MDQDQQRDAAEEADNANLCPLCGQSPCAGGAEAGSCDVRTVRLDMSQVAKLAHLVALTADRLDRRADSLPADHHAHAEALRWWAIQRALLDALDD